jgi:adenylate kinase family enzyme
MNVFGFAGVIGSGKSTIAKDFAKNNKLLYVSTGDYLRNILKENNLDTKDREIIQSFFQDKYNNDWTNFCKALFDDINIDCGISGVVVDSIRGKESYFALKEYFENINVYVVFCDINWQMSIERQKQRGDKIIYTINDRHTINDFEHLNYFMENADIVLDTSRKLEDTIMCLQNWHINKNI